MEQLSTSCQCTAPALDKSLYFPYLFPKSYVPLLSESLTFSYDTPLSCTKTLSALHDNHKWI